MFAIFRRGALLALVLSLTLPLIGVEPRQYKESELALITRLASRLLEKNHYRRQPLNQEIGRKLFDEYFDALDPERALLTADDVRSFESWRDSLAEQVRRGDNSFAFAVYCRFVQRYEEFQKFAEERLKHPFDFTGNDEFQTDRSRQPRPAGDSELHQLWEQRLKNDVLTRRLIVRALNEEAKSGNAEARKNSENALLWNQKTPEEKLLRRLRDLHNEVTKKEPIDILGIFLNTLAQVYGPHSNYLPPKHDEDFEINMSLSLTGIGATLTSDDGFIKIVALVPGGPAALSGKLKVNDRIIAVTQENGETTDLIDMPVSQAVQYIRGPVDSKLTLKVIPGEKGRTGSTETVELVRKKVDLVEAGAKGEIREVRGANDKVRRIGVITLKSFYMDFDAVMQGRPDARRCSTDVRRIMEKFIAENVDGVLIDLRRNGGGSLPEAFALSAMFLPTAPLVQIRDTSRRVALERDNDPGIIYSGPLVVLTSKFSASSSEIFTAALRDASRAVVVGDSRTFGKGTILKVERFELPRRFFSDDMPTGSVTYETAVFYRPRGDSVQQLGIEPDIVLPSLTEEFEVGEMFLDNHLPWDSIKPAPGSVKFDSGLENKIAALKKRSDKRVAADSDYARLRKRIDLFRRFRDRKSVSLNEARRWADYQQEKDLNEETEKLLNDSGSGEKALRTEFDPVLREAERITADLADMG